MPIMIRALALAIAGASLTACNGIAAPESSSTVVRPAGDPGAPNETGEGYWTEERMREARPQPLGEDSGRPAGNVDHRRPCETGATNAPCPPPGSDVAQ